MEPPPPKSSPNGAKKGPGRQNISKTKTMQQKKGMPYKEQKIKVTTQDHYFKNTLRFLCAECSSWRVQQKLRATKPTRTLHLPYTYPTLTLYLPYTYPTLTRSLVSHSSFFFSSLFCIFAFAQPDNSSSW